MLMSFASRIEQESHLRQVDRQRKGVKYAAVFLFILLIALTQTVAPTATLNSDRTHPNPEPHVAHPRLLFSQSDLPEIKRRASLPILQPTVKRLLERAEWQLTAPQIIPSISKRGEPDP